MTLIEELYARAASKRAQADAIRDGGYADSPHPAVAKVVNEGLVDLAGDADLLRQAADELAADDDPDSLKNKALTELRYFFIGFSHLAVSPLDKASADSARAALRAYEEANR